MDVCDQLRIAATGEIGTILGFLRADVAARGESVLVGCLPEDWAWSVIALRLPGEHRPRYAYQCPTDLAWEGPSFLPISELQGKRAAWRDSVADAPVTLAERHYPELAHLFRAPSAHQMLKIAAWRTACAARAGAA